MPASTGVPVSGPGTKRKPLCEGKLRLSESWAEEKGCDEVFHPGRSEILQAKQESRAELEPKLRELKPFPFCPTG